MDRKTEANQANSLGVERKTALPFDGPWIVNPFRAQVDSSQIDGGGDLVPVCQMLWPTKLRTEADTKHLTAAIAALPEMVAALLEWEAASHAIETGDAAGQSIYEDRATDLTSRVLAKIRGAA